MKKFNLPPLFILLLLLFWIPVFTQFLVTLLSPINFKYYGANEWLINYSAGFVRRGLGGEFISLLSTITPVPFYTWIKIISVVSFVAYTLIIAHCLRKKNISYFLIFCPVFCYCLFIYPEFSFYRKDSLLMCLAFLSFWSLMQILRRESELYLLSFIICTSLGLLLHEAYFFYVLPVSWLLAFSALRSSHQNKSVLIGLIICSIIFFLCLLAKGNLDMAKVIWSSWNGYFENSYYEQWLFLPPSGSIKAIGGDTLLFIKEHLRLNFVEISGLLGIRNAFLFILMMVLYFYIIVFECLLRNKMCNSDTKKLATILIIQMFSMSPFFIFLSCDYGRLVFYCFSTTIFLYALLEPQEYSLIWNAVPRVIKKMYLTLLSSIFKFYHFLGICNLKSYLSIFTIVSFPMVNRPGAYLVSLKENTIFGSLLQLIKSVIF